MPSFRNPQVLSHLLPCPALAFRASKYCKIAVTRNPPRNIRLAIFFLTCSTYLSHLQPLIICPAPHAIQHFTPHLYLNYFPASTKAAPLVGNPGCNSSTTDKPNMQTAFCSSWDAACMCRDFKAPGWRMALRCSLLHHGC